MVLKKGWRERFAESVNKELTSYSKERPGAAKRDIIMGMKDAVYLLGVAINPNEYKWAPGFVKFCEELGIDFSVLRKLRG